MDSRRFKIVKTVTLVMIWVAMGLYYELAGPTMIDLKMLFNVGYETIAWAVSARGAGVFLGALVAGLFVDATGRWKDLFVTGAQVLAAIVVTLMPYIDNISLLWFFFFAMGISSGIVNVAGQRILLEMWQEKTPAPMHAMHAGFGIGAVAAPLIANPFLAILQLDDVTGGNITANGTFTTATTTPTYHVIQPSRVQHAYVIIGILTAAISLPFATMLCFACMQPDYRQVARETEKSPKSLKELLNPGTYANGSVKYGSIVFVIIVLYFGTLVGGEQLFGNFIRTFSVDQLKFPRNVASYLDTTFWSCFTVGRLLGALLSHRIPVRFVFFAYALLNLIAVTFLDIFSADSAPVLWVFTCLVGLLIAPLYPSGMSFSNTQIEVGGVVLTLAVFGGGLGDMLFVWLSGHMYDIVGPRAVLYGAQSSAVLVFVIAVTFLVVGRYHGDRFVNKMADMVQLEDALSDQTLDESTPIQQRATHSED